MFSIIIPYKGGNPQREESLSNLLKCLKAQESLDPTNNPIIFELIIVEQTILENNYNAHKRIKEIVPQELAELKYVQLVNPDIRFNKSWCINVGAKKSYYDHLIIMDADSLFGKDYLRTIKDYVENTNPNHNKIMFCWDKLICMPGKDNPVTRYISPKNTLAMGAIWYINKHFLFNQLG